MTDPTLPPETPDAPAAADLVDEHNYDGIQEYDNPIPGWWKWIFIGTIIWSPLYLMWFHAPNQERTVADGYEQAFAANQRQRFGELGDLTADEATIARFMQDEEWLKVGASVFSGKCATCHGGDGAGASGPNLTDDLFIHIESLEDIATVLQKGANAGAMPAWEDQLHPAELIITAAYVANLRGENLSGAYSGEAGEPIDPWPEFPADAPSGDAGDGDDDPAD